MNTQLNNSDERGGKGKYIIPVGETGKHYNDMLLQALAQTKDQAFQARKHTQAARANMKARDQAFWSQFSRKHTLLPFEEESPASAYQQHLAMIEQEPTKLLMPPSPQPTDAIDISLVQTRIEPNWNPRDVLASFTELECSPVTERHERITKRLSIPLPGPLDMQPAHHNYYASDCALRPLVETGVDLYIRDYGCRPTLIEISTAARSLLPVIADWEEGYPYRDELIPIIGNPQLEINAVRCWGN